MDETDQEPFPPGVLRAVIVISWSDFQEAGVHESTKGASVEDHVRQLRRYKGEFVRDLAYGTVRLPVAWLAPGDATILALDALALLDADQSIRFKELLDQCVHLVDLIESLINTFIGQHKATGIPVHEERPGVAAPRPRTGPGPRPAVPAVLGLA